MKTILKIEEAAMLMLAVYLFQFTGYSWWMFALFFLAPDLGLLGYLVNPSVGSFTYNLFHHKGIAIALYITGLMLGMLTLQFAGLLLFAHASFDRILGYGLKYKDSFKNTQLGMIGN